MQNQLLQFSLCVLMGFGFRLLFLGSTKLGDYLKLKPVYITIDFIAISICAVVAGLFMIYFAERIAIFLCIAIVVGFVICDLSLDFVRAKKPLPNT